MTTAFRSNIDEMAQANMRDLVNNNLKPFSPSSYPTYCRTDFFTTFDRDPLLAHPSFYGTIANDSEPIAANVRKDIIDLAGQYGNIVRCRYGNHTLQGLIGGGTGYFACSDSLPAFYDPAADPGVDKLLVGRQGVYSGYSNGGPMDDGVVGTDTNVGSINGLNTTNDRVRLSNWGTDYCGTNADKRLYLRLNKSGRSANGWHVTIYGPDKSVIGSGILSSRMDISSGYAYVMQEPFDLTPYAGQLVYIRIRANAPPLSIPPSIIYNQRNRLADALRQLPSFSGDMFRESPSSVYTQAWQMILNSMDPYVVDLTTYAYVAPTLPVGTNRFLVGTGNGFTGFSDGGGVDDGVAGTNATCGAIDGVNRTNFTPIANWNCNYFGTNSSGYLYMRFINAGTVADSWTLTLYDEQYQPIISGQLMYRQGERSGAWYLPIPFSLVPYIGRTIYISVL